MSSRCYRAPLSQSVSMIVLIFIRAPCHDHSGGVFSLLPQGMPNPFPFSLWLLPLLVQFLSTFPRLGWHLVKRCCRIWRSNYFHYCRSYCPLNIKIALDSHLFSFYQLWNQKEISYSDLATSLHTHKRLFESRVSALWEARWPPGKCARLRSERSGFEPWPGTPCCVLRQDTLLSQYLSPPRCINGYRISSGSYEPVLAARLHHFVSALMKPSKNKFSMLKRIN